MPTFQFKTRTDSNGYFSHTKEYNPPGPFGFKVKLTGELLRPTGTRVAGLLDIDAKDGGTFNPERKFAGAAGQKLDLGSWKIDGADNVIVLTGKTLPAKPDTDLEIRVTVDT